MPPKKLSHTSQQQKQQNPSQSNTGPKGSAPSTSNESTIPEHEIKKASSLNAQFALEATKKAYELRQAAYGAGDPNAREEILAKAINKEIEAESFGKAAKYTRSGAFQGLAAGAGLGVVPGVTIGQLTAALVGGLLSSVGALLGGGIGAAYGAINGPFWDLGQIASQGVRSIVGDFPNWEATSGQKKALEKMVLGAQKTKKPSEEELMEMKDDNGGATEEDYRNFHQNLTSWIPSMPSMPNLPSMPSMPSAASIQGLGGLLKGKDSSSTNKKATTTTMKSSTTSTPRNISGIDSKPHKQSTEDASGKGSSPKTKDQPKQLQNDPKTNETVTKKRPKKLEIRSTSTTSQSDQPVTKRRPPKLEPRPKSTAKA